MRVFDVHVHIFPEKIALKAAKAIGKFYDADMRHDGTLETALHLMDDAGVEAFCAHSVATSPSQCAHINEFVMASAQANPGRIVPFAALHPKLENMEEYVDTALKQGFRGFKIHPDIQAFALDRPDVVEMIGTIAGKAPLLIHTGDARYENSGPKKVEAILDRFPNLMIIGAHLGGYSQWDEAEERLTGRNMYVDTSSTLFELDPKKAVKMIREYGTDKVLFGSDYPMWTPKQELEKFLALDLTQQEQEDILWNNAARLFGLA